MKKEERSLLLSPGLWNNKREGASYLRGLGVVGALDGVVQEANGAHGLASRTRMYGEIGCMEKLGSALMNHDDSDDDSDDDIKEDDKTLSQAKFTKKTNSFHVSSI